MTTADKPYWAFCCEGEIIGVGETPAEAFDYGAEGDTEGLRFEWFDPYNNDEYASECPTWAEHLTLKRIDSDTYKMHVDSRDE